MAAIAAEAGLPILTLYRAFPSKPAILCAFSRRIDETVLAAPLDTDPDERPRDRVFDLLMRRFDALRPHRDALEVLGRELPGDPVTALALGAALLRSMALDAGSGRHRDARAARRDRGKADGGRLCLRRCACGCATIRPIWRGQWRRWTGGCAASSAGWPRRGGEGGNRATGPLQARPEPGRFCCTAKLILTRAALRSDIGIVRCTNFPTSLPTEPSTMSDARPNPFDFDVTKIFADFRLRPFDVEAVWAAQRRNIEALSQANQAAVEGVHAVARRNIELTRETFEGLSALMRDLAQPVSAEDRIAKNTEYAKKLLEKGVNHGREVATIAAKAGADAAEILHRRATEGLDEFRSFASQQTHAALIAPLGKHGRPPARQSGGLFVSGYWLGNLRMAPSAAKPLV